MRVIFWGVRGSCVTPESANQRYGGNTPCVEVSLGPGRSLLFDAGLGLRWQSHSMLDRGKTGNQLEILLSHCHWDHIQGIPFAPMMYLAGNRITLYGSGESECSLQSNLLQQLRPEFCPVPNFFEQAIGADIEVRQLTSRAFLTDLGVKVAWARLPRGRTRSWVVGYRIEYAGRSVAYLSDVEYRDPICPEALDLCREVDLLIHDAQFLPDERAETLDRGHSSYAEVIALSRAAQPRRTVCCHHDPSRSDRELDQVAAWLAQLNDVLLEVAYEGLEIDFTN